MNHNRDLQWFRAGQAVDTDIPVVRLSSGEEQVVFLGLTQDELDVVIGCMFVGECGGERGPHPYIAESPHRNYIANGSKRGGLILSRIPEDIIEASLVRLRAGDRSTLHEKIEERQRKI